MQCYFCNAYENVKYKKPLLKLKNLIIIFNNLNIQEPNNNIQKELFQQIETTLLSFNYYKID